MKTNGKASVKRAGAIGARVHAFRGDRLQALLDETGTSHAVFARFLGTSQGCVSRWVRGGQGNPLLPWIEKMAYWFDCPVGYLLGEIDQRSARVRAEQVRAMSALTRISDGAGEEMVVNG